MEFKIKSLREIEVATRQQVAEVFVQTYYKDLKAIAKNENCLIRGFNQHIYMKKSK